MTFFSLNRCISYKLLLCLYLPAGVLLLTVLLASVHMDIPLAMFTRDPADITHTSPFLGVVSNICILLWCASAAICFFSFFVLRKTGANSAAIFFLFSGLLTSMLMLDDLFLLHERIFPEYLHWRQRYIYLSYVSIVLVYLTAFRHIIFKNNFLLLALALGFFFLSVAVDCMATKMETLVLDYHLFEDGFKLFGLASWLGYFGEKSLYMMFRPDG
ncbi:hypothetical protein Pcar_0627 [Syntrophotalea carbinolica DSM 2380]|uniref:Uncharacterized protein n=1 Tax=Syntrophotalea carbinolica (strain DSM 2380 / NBRC 103641 / GraBd1) TaxID=338963 RepID=Q3A6X1_SYNC1|nr:hypothetical protein [Syntrophotalea carbinolica]ABA87886.1 hypothetical protein Pcar_0627 [Syntrophotalea carbinolica DSM 2380]